MNIFRSKYRRRITIALIKAKMKLVDIEREKATWVDVHQQANCIMRMGDIHLMINLLDALLKGREIKF